jgi:DNA (cytosine-5)-methyltransferase 1
MNHASLFSGIGGFDLAAEWMGWTNVFNCEWEEFPRQVLKHHFPNAKQYGDIRELRATAYAGRIDILTGGFPCQPYSLAGKRKGKEDERHLWPEMLRVIRECSPRYVVGENVRGLVGWNGGMVFEEVCSDLETQGYSVQPFVLPACGVGAPHRRDRIWFVAYADNDGKKRTSRRDESKGRSERVQERHEVQQFDKSNIVRQFSSDTMRTGGIQKHGGRKTGQFEMTGSGSQLSPLFVEEMMGFPKNWTALPFQSGDEKA